MNISGGTFGAASGSNLTNLTAANISNGAPDHLRGWLFTVAYQLADLCRLITLEPGDVILTGTPANSRPMKPGDVVEVEISGIGRLTNTIEEWDVDLAGPGEQMQVSAQTLHVALAIPEDEAERLVAEGREP